MLIQHAFDMLSLEENEIYIIMCDYNHDSKALDLCKLKKL